MNTLSAWGELVACNDSAEIAEVAAQRIAAAIEAKQRTQPVVSLALSGGTTPRATYARLATVKNIDWRKVLFFWVDERAVPSNDPRSNYRMVEETLLNPLPVSRSQVTRMQAELPDRHAAAKAYDKVLRERLSLSPALVPRIDVLTLGMGADGHTASLFPHDQALDEYDSLVAAVEPSEGREARLTMTYPLLLNAANIFILVSGAEKTRALELAWAPSGDARETPMRALRNATGATTWLVDRAAHPLKI